MNQLTVLTHRSLPLIKPLFCFLLCARSPCCMYVCVHRPPYYTKRHASPTRTGLFLTIRYLNAVGGEDSGLGHVHDYLVAELQRLMQVEAGGVVLATLAGALLGVKSRLGRADGLLPLAELVLSLFSECPGLARWVGFSALRC